MKHRILIIALMLFGLILFFVDMGHGPGSAVYQLYGFAHLAFFMAMAMVLSRWSLLAPRPFWMQAVGTIGAILMVGGIIWRGRPQLLKFNPLKTLRWFRGW